MPRDDREQNFDKALARSFRSSGAPHGNDANDCLDAETLAAYHERLLDPEEMAQRKTHIASCERCQEILAQLEATDTIPVEADRELLLDQIVLDIPETEPAAAIPEAAPVAPPQPRPNSAESVTAAIPPAETPSHQKSGTEPELEIEHEPDLVAASAALPSSDQSRAATTAAPAPAAAVVAKSMPSSATITFRAPREDRPRMVRFVAIAGALAAGLIFWLVYRDQTKPVDVAQNFPAKKLELPPESPAPPQAIDNAEEKRDARPQSSEPNAAASPSPAAPAPVPPQAQPAPSKSPTDNVTNALDDAKKTIDSAKALQQKQRSAAGDLTAGSAGTPGTPNPALSARADLSRNGLYAPRETSKAQSQRIAPKVEAPSLDSSAAAPSTAANAASQPAANSPFGIPATPPPARTKMNPSVITEALTVSPTTPVAGVTTPVSDSLSKSANGRIAAAVTPLSVPAPDGTTIWRIGQAGMIQRSTDSGATWSIQPSGVVSDLIAGSAYSGQVCWLVGRNGTILRTINGGATWQKLTSPSNVDLLSIFSINADSATITDAAGRAFETTTAGTHWTRTRLQQ
jgi:hypothetical protein